MAMQCIVNGSRIWRGWGTILLMIPVLSSWLVAGEGAGTTADKRSYNLFNPTPRSEMREFSADRPDKTDSPLTVDAGHFQVEMDLVNLVFDRHHSDRSPDRRVAYEVAPMNLKVGVLNSVDLQLVVSPYRSERVRDPITGAVEKASGAGDFIPRLKWNLIGNDGGPFALAVMPFVKLPTASRGLGNGDLEGGLKIPYAFDVPGWELGVQTEVDVIRDQKGSGHHAEWIQSVSLGRPVFGKWSLYVEWYNNVSLERGAGVVGTFDTWVTYQVHDGLRLEAGVYIGATRAAEDWHPFLGLTWRY